MLVISYKSKQGCRIERRILFEEASGQPSSASNRKYFQKLGSTQIYQEFNNPEGQKEKDAQEVGRT